MQTLARLIDTLHLLALGIWIGALAMSGAVAAMIFPTMRDLDPTFALFAAYSGDHSPLGAGFIQARVFAAADIVQFTAASIVLLSFIVAVLLRRSLGKPITMIRGTLIACAAVMLSYHLFILAPRMDQHARDYWSFAQTGQNDLAQQAHDAFMSDHPAARRTMLFIALFSVASFVASGLAVGAPVRPEARP